MGKLKFKSLSVLYVFLALKESANNQNNLFSSLEITDIVQGNLHNCLFFAALASILNLPNGSQYIRQAIPYYNEVKSFLLYYI